MKKIFSLVSVATMLLGAVNVAEAKAADKAKEKKVTPPEIYLSVFDTTTNPFTDLKTTKLSRSNPNLQLCWIAQGTFYQQVNLIETFKAPAPQKMVAEGARIATSEDGKTNAIRGPLDSLNRGKVLVKCWRFDENDPLGKYSLQVQVVKKVYPPLSFSVVK